MVARRLLLKQVGELANALLQPRSSQWRNRVSRSNQQFSKEPWASLRAQFPSVAASQWTILEQWAQLIRDWNAKINLISRKDINFLELRHLAHCLAITNHLKLMQGARVLDVGTGGGFPGLVMAIAYPQAQFTLVDSLLVKKSWLCSH